MKINRILVIDDNINATRVARLILERTGRYEVRELNDPGQALEIAREFGPDLVLLDVCMPNVEGSAVAETINGDPGFADTPIVFLTCIVTPREVGKNGTRVIGRHEYIAKPARPDILIACIERNLARIARPSQTTEYAPLH
ncbi:MAG TPA: response regulator [Verrucomicrobiae bacterium]|nr:response regulator [Verrucomicrobiae bacterium]